MRGWLRRWDGFAAGAALAAMVAALWWLRAGEEVAGRVRVIDGDTVEVAGRTVRLAGMDAPELAQLCGPPGAPVRCGERAREALRGLTAEVEFACRLKGRDRWGRDLGACAVHGRDVGARLVSDGLAVAFGAYEAEEREARAAGRGLWAGPFERPSEWRRRRAEATGAEPTPPPPPRRL